MIVADPKKRLSSQQVLLHPWLQGSKLASLSPPSSSSTLQKQKEEESPSKKVDPKEKKEKSSSEEKKKKKKMGEVMDSTEVSSEEINNLKSSKARKGSNSKNDFKQEYKAINTSVPSETGRNNNGDEKVNNDEDSNGQTTKKRKTNSKDDSEKSLPKKTRKTSNQTPTLPVCKYGESCFRRNPKHFLEFSHPWKDQQPK